MSRLVQQTTRLIIGTTLISFGGSIMMSNVMMD